MNPPISIAAVDLSGLLRTGRPSPKVPSSRGRKSPKRRAFGLEAYLESTTPGRMLTAYRRGEVVFSQGDAAEDVRYVQKGEVKISVTSPEGREAIVAMLGPGDFFGEGVLAGQATRIATATATVASSVLSIDSAAMFRLLNDEPTFSNRFITYMLTRNIRVEADLVDHFFNSSEKRLARMLLLLARFGDVNAQRTLPDISQTTLAEMIGSTRSRVNFFMTKFKKLGFIECECGIKVNHGLLSVALHD